MRRDVHTEPDETKTFKDLAKQLERMGDLLERDIKMRSWQVALRNGLLAGLGGVIGATLVASLLISMLRWFSPIQGIGPALERIAEALEQK